MATPTGTQAVDRAARLVTEVVRASDSVTFTELAAATGLAKSTTSRLLDALERGGLIRRDDDGRFRPGDVFVRYAWRGGAEAGLIEVARPFLDRLGGQTGETVNLGVARDGLVEQVAQVDSTYLIGGTNWVGPAGAAALRRAGQGPAGLRRGAAAAGPAGGPHQPDADQPGRARGQPPPGRGAAGTRSPTGNWSPGWWRWPPPSTGTARWWWAPCRCPRGRAASARGGIPAVAAQCVAQALALSEVLGHRAPAAPAEPGGQPENEPGARERART